MLETALKQFKLTEEGEIYFQPDPTNPLPGVLVGTIKKGESLLNPSVIAVDKDGADKDGVDKNSAHKNISEAKIKEGLQAHINEVLQPLAALMDEEEIQKPARDIAEKLYGALGILPRSALEKEISGLDEEGRRALRQRKVRLGPVLVFLPMLSKPASVRLCALLWSLWHDKPLPADVPKDGVTSISVVLAAINPLYYRSIGYPVYGKRAIRVDMLDRLIGCVYDSADKGLFKAQHAMAEWLGCPIADLYDVLEDMGHKKIYDPADEPEKEEQKEEQKEELKEALPQDKPELATFRLRKGQAYGTEPRQAPSKKYRKPKRPPFKKQGQKKASKPPVMSAAAAKKMENSPFAMLKDMKIKSKEQ